MGAVDRNGVEGISVGLADGCGQPAALAAEDEHVIGAKANGRIRWPGRAGCEEEQPSGRASGQKGFPTGVAGEDHVLPIVEPGATDVLVVDEEAQGIDEMERDEE